MADTDKGRFRARKRKRPVKDTGGRQHEPRDSVSPPAEQLSRVDLGVKLEPEDPEKQYPQIFETSDSENKTIASLEKEVLNRLGQISHLKVDLEYAEDNAKYYHDCLVEKDQKITEAESRADRYRERFDEKVKQITKVESQFENYRARLDAKNEKIDDDEVQLARYRERLEEKNKQITDSEFQLEEVKARAKHDSKVAETEFLRKKDYHQNLLIEQTQVINLGRSHLKTKTADIERLTKDNHDLRAVMDEKDRNLAGLTSEMAKKDHDISALNSKIEGLNSEIAGLNSEIICFSAAPEDQVAEMAREAQAQRTLNLVQGLKNEIAERENVIKGCKSQLAELNTTKDNYQSAMKRMKATIDENEKVIQGARKEKDEIEKALEAARKEAEANKILEDQAKAIQRLMDENSRLVENQKP